MEDGLIVQSEGLAEEYARAFEPDSLGLPRQNGYLWSHYDYLLGICAQLIDD